MKRGIALASAIMSCALAAAARAEPADHPADPIYTQAVAPPESPSQPSRAVGRTHDCSVYYPRLSKLMDEAGYVFLGYDVGADGAIVNVRLFGSSGFKRLDDASLACVHEKWQNTPATKDAVAVASPDHHAALRFWLSGMEPEDDLFARGVVEYSRGDFAAALATFDAELAAKPDSARAYRARAAVYEASGQHRRALEDVAKADALSPPR